MLIGGFTRASPKRTGLFIAAPFVGHSTNLKDTLPDFSLAFKYYLVVRPIFTYGLSMARKPNTEFRRQQIVAAMQRVMAQSGYAGATVQAIASQSGLAPGLVHYHFRDKREILVELVSTLAGYATQRYERRVADASTPQQRLRAYIDARLSYGADAQPDAVAAWVMIGAEAVRDPDVREVYQRTVIRELALIESLLKARSLELGRRTRKLGDLAAALLAFNEGVFALATNARGVLPIGFAADMAMAWVERYLAAEGPATPRVTKPKSRPSQART
jgi:TetR/AcrR family transcriptional repressor of bet genes